MIPDLYKAQVQFLINIKPLMKKVKRFFSETIYIHMQLLHSGEQKTMICLLGDRSGRDDLGDTK